MDDFIILGNIERFKQKLKNSHDQSERQVLRDLLAEERQRLLHGRSLEH